MKCHIRSRICFRWVGGLAVFPLGIFLFNCFHLSGARAAVAVKPHHLRIEREDTLSEALDLHFPDRTWRLWGKRGAIARVAALNPQVADVNRLSPGMVLDIGEYSNSEPAVEKRVPASQEVVQETQAVAPPVVVYPAPVVIVPVVAPAVTPTLVPVAIATPAPKLPTEPALEPLPLPIKDERYGFLSVAPDLSFSRIDATDRSTGGSATFLSNLDPGVQVSWGQHWSDRLQTSLSLGERTETFLAPSDGTSLESPNHNLVGIGFGGKWIPFGSFSDLAVDARISFQQELFARSTSLTSTTLDSLMIPEATAGLRYRVLDLSPFSMALHADVLFLSPARTSNYSVQYGTGYLYGAAITENFSKKIQISGDFWYSTQSQASSIAVQDLTTVGVTFGFTFRFDTILKPDELKRGDLP